MDNSLQIDDIAGRLISLTTEWTQNTSSFRGFEIPTISILLHLTKAAEQTLVCGSDDLAKLCGLPPSTADRLVRVLANCGHLSLAEIDEGTLYLSMNERGNALAMRIIAAAEGICGPMKS